MKRICSLIALAAVTASTHAGFAQIAAAPATGRGPVPAPATSVGQSAAERSDSVTTTGTLKPAGKGEMTYTAVSGYLPLKDEAGKLRANVFSVAYVAAPSAAPAPAAGTQAAAAADGSATKIAPLGNAFRPVTFLFNGGPGAASAWLHLAVGPRRLDVPADGAAPVAPYLVIETE